MFARATIVSVFLLLPTGILHAQCPDWQQLALRLRQMENTEEPSQHSGMYLYELSEYERRLEQCADRNDSIQAWLLQRIATLQYDKVDYANALITIKKAINLCNASSGLASRQVKNYYLLYMLYDELKQSSNRISAIDSCINISITHNSPGIYTLEAIKERIKYSFNKGEYQTAYETAILGETLLKKMPAGQHEDYENTYTAWSINALIALKNFDPAITLLQQKIVQARKKKTNNALGTYYEQLAQAAFEKGNITLARESFQHAYQYDLESKLYFGCAQILNNIGYYIHHNQQRNYDSAILCYKKSLLFLQKASAQTTFHNIELLNVYGNIADAYAQKNDFDNAFKYFTIAFDQLKPGIINTDLLQAKWIESSSVKYIWTLLIKKSDAYIRKYKLQEQTEDINQALSICKFTDRLLDRIREGQTEQESKLFWRKDARKLYEHAIEACYLARRPEEALYFFEKSRATLLFDQLNEQQLFDEEDLHQIAQVKKRILELERETTNVVNEDISKEIFSRKQHLNQLLHKIRLQTPFYFQTALDTSTISQAALQRYLSQNDQSLLALFWGENKVYTLAVTANNIQLKAINKSSFEECATAYVSCLANPVTINNEFTKFADYSKLLYQLIFDGSPPSQNRIIISPDGINFPFESLITNDNVKQPSYFINSRAVSYTYSVRFLMNEFNAPVQNSKVFLGMAPVTYPASMNLATLHGSDISLKRIGGYFSNTLNQVTQKASKENFLRNFYKYNIIQLYTHAASTSIHQEPVIYFSDSALYLSDLISDRKPATRLIVLSACETGSGKDYAGEGIFSFNRGFAALGIPSAVANLWAVDNTSTYQLTELFYKYLSGGLPTDIALQKAKLEFMQLGGRQHSIPYYWAAPVLVGKPDLISFENQARFPWVIVLVTTTSLLVLAVLYTLTRFKKQSLRNNFINRPVAGA